jgi:thiamine biosynthesis lipoprotein
MGVAWTVTVFTETLPKAEKAITAALDEVSRLENVLSDYQPTSELCQLSALAPTPCPKKVSPDLWEVLVQAAAWRDRSQGAFDPTVGVFTALWRKARQTRHLPSVRHLATARNASGPEAFRIEDAHKVSLLKPDMRLDLGGIGMGFAIDRALNIVQSHGIAVAMIDASGDIGVIGRPPDSDGDAFQAIEIEGIRYSHIVDPRTGIGVVGSAGVTVIAPDATTADALATTLSVLGPEAGYKFVEKTEDCSARFVWYEAGKVRVRTSSQWSSQTSYSAPKK